MLEVRLVEKRQLAPAVRELTFERTDGATFAFEAGQWVSLVLPHPEVKCQHMRPIRPSNG